MRDRLYQQHRPNPVIRDDLENAITAEKIIRLLDEAWGGCAGHGLFLILENYILENGIMEGRSIPVTDHSGAAWPAKFVETDAEAVEVN